jgi:hypothetical protein
VIKANETEHAMMTDADLETVVGGATVGLSVQNQRSIPLQQELTAAYARSNPIDYYGYFG